MFSKYSKSDEFKNHRKNAGKWALIILLLICTISGAWSSEIFNLMIEFKNESITLGESRVLRGLPRAHQNG